MVMTVGFTGSKKGLGNRQIGELRRMVADPSVGTVHHGGCVGGDELCHQFALYVGKNIVVHPPRDVSLCGDYIAPKWSKSKVVAAPECKESALPIDDIIDACDVLIVCPDCIKDQEGSPTQYAIRRAKKLGKKVKILLPAADDDFIGGDGRLI